MSGKSFPDLKGSRIGREGNKKRILDLSHCLTIFAFPARLIPLLIEVIRMMSQNVMQYPAIGNDSRLKAENQLQQVVQHRGSKRRHVLMMVVLGGDESLGKDTKEEPANNESNVPTAQKTTRSIIK